MKKYGKIAAALLAAVLMLGLIAGCGSKSASSDSDKPVLRVAMECAYAPFNWTQTDDSNGAYPIAGTDEYANGYDVMFAKALCDELGYELEIYKTDWDSLILGLQSDKYDALICGMNILPERKEAVAFTSPYRLVSNCIIFRNDSEYASAESVAELDGCSAITQLATNWEPLMDEIPNVTKVASVGSTSEIAMQVASGKADIGITDDPTAAVICMNNPDLGYKVFDEGNGFSTDGTEDSYMAIAVRLDDTELLDALNQAMADLGLDQTDVQQEYMDDAIAILSETEVVE